MTLTIRLFFALAGLNLLLGELYIVYSVPNEIAYNYILPLIS